MNKKKRINAMAFCRMPFLIYLVLTIAMVPAVSSVEYKAILGAHRGDSVTYTENTLDAILEALENEKYNFIEFDIQYTKDKKIIVFHDTSLLRIESKPENISELTYQEMQDMTNFHVPLYEEAIDLIKNRKKINIEIKSVGNLENDKELIDFIVKDAKEKQILKNIMISSISREAIIYSKEKYPDVKTGQIFWIASSTYIPFDFMTQEIFQEADETKADYIMLHGSNINNIKSLTQLKPKNKTLVFWYFNDEIYLIQKDKNDVIW